MSQVLKRGSEAGAKPLLLRLPADELHEVFHTGEAVYSPSRPIRPDSLGRLDQEPTDHLVPVYHT